MNVELMFVTGNDKMSPKKAQFTLYTAQKIKGTLEHHSWNFRNISPFN